MQKRDPEAPKFSENEKEVLRAIIDQTHIPDSEIARGIGISPQAVFKIRNKLESMGVIKGYVPIIDFKKIGIHVLTLLILRFTPNVWNRCPDDLVSERLSKIPYLIAAYRISEARASHILLMGFRDTAQREQFLSMLQTKYADDIEIKESYTFSVDKIIIQNPIRLLNEMLDKTEFTQYDLFPPKK